MKTSSELLGDALLRARRHWAREPSGEVQVAPAQQADVAFTIAFSREEGSGGSEVARQVAQQLEWALYDKALLTRIAAESGKREELLASLDERRTSWLTDVLEAFSGASGISSAAYAHGLAQVLAALSAHGNCVIVGRGAVALLPADRTLRVRIVAEAKDRTARVADALGLSPQEARRHIEKTDRERIAFVKSHFHRDITECRLYDVCLNSSTFGVEECATLVLQALERRRQLDREPGG
jgi:cytidylate kinase